MKCNITTSGYYGEFCAKHKCAKYPCSELLGAHRERLGDVVIRKVKPT